MTMWTRSIFSCAGTVCHGSNRMNFVNRVHWKPLIISARLTHFYVIQRSGFSSLSQFESINRTIGRISLCSPVVKLACHGYEVEQRYLQTWTSTWRSYVTNANPTSVVKAKVRGIQKDISPLTTKRIVRRKKTKDSLPRDQEIFDVVAYATAEQYGLEGLHTDLVAQGLYGVVTLPNDANEMLQVEALYRVGDEPREIFFFREGAVIFWNMPEVEREAVLKFLRRHQDGSYDEMLFKEEYEHVEFTYTEQATSLQGDEIQLHRPTEGGAKTNHQLEKYAFSNAIALSVKLSIWEASLDRYVDSIEYVLEDLRLGKKLKMTHREILRKTGELLSLRHLINLSTDLLDTPDFYWDRETLEALYSKTCNHLQISRRTKVMNEKLNHCYELAELLRDQIKDGHHIRLEWMIIILIMIEVFFEILHMIERFR